MAIKVNRINRSFKIKVHLYFNSSSFNRVADGTPRFFIKPVELLNVEKVGFTRGGSTANKYSKYGNRFWKYKYDDTLTDARCESIYNEIKNSYPYGYVQDDTASTNKYNLDVKENEAFQSFYKSYWDNNEDKITQPKVINGVRDYPHPYIEYIANEIITYKHNVGTVPTLDQSLSEDVMYPKEWDEYYYEQEDKSCHRSVIDITLDSYRDPNYFLVDAWPSFPITLNVSGRYRLDLESGGYYHTWPTGEGGAWSGCKFRFSTGVDGTNKGHTEYSDGISYVESPERGYFHVKVLTKTAVSSPGDDGHPYMYQGHTSGFALSGSGDNSSATGINISGFGYDEGAMLTLRRESEYSFLQDDVSNSGHIFQITTHPSGLNSGLYTDGTSTGDSFFTFTVPYDAPDKLYYSCQTHSYMGGEINIIDSPEAPKTGSIPGESIIINNTGGAERLLYYYSPDISGAGGMVLLKSGCGPNDTFQGM